MFLRFKLFINVVNSENLKSYLILYFLFQKSVFGIASHKMYLIYSFKYSGLFSSFTRPLLFDLGRYFFPEFAIIFNSFNTSCFLVFDFIYSIVSVLFNTLISPVKTISLLYFLAKDNASLSKKFPISKSFPCLDTCLTIFLF